MQYALVDGQRVEAKPGLKGQCPACGSPVIARCGEIRVHHWAHRGERKCDVWWEPETEWHREWKGRFPETWREFIQRAPDGEKHIADIRSPSGRVIEFQHSFLKSDERRAREAFYGDMLWVVDGMRRQRDRKRFIEAVTGWRNWGSTGRVFVTPFAHEGLPVEWMTSPVPVYFDFGEEHLPWERKELFRPSLWCLLPQRPAGNAVIVQIPKAGFIARCSEDQEIFDAKRLVENIIRVLIKRERRRQAEYSAYNQQLAWRPRRRRYARF